MKNKKYVVVFFLLALVFLVNPVKALALTAPTGTQVFTDYVAFTCSNGDNRVRAYDSSLGDSATAVMSTLCNTFEEYTWSQFLNETKEYTLVECTGFCEEGESTLGSQRLHETYVSGETEIDFGGGEEAPAVSGIVIFPSDKDFTAGISGAISSSTGSLWPLLICIIGTLIAFEVLISIRDLIMRKGEKERAGREVKEKKGKFSWSEINKERPKILK